MRASQSFVFVLTLLWSVTLAASQIPAGSSARTIPNELENSSASVSEIIAVAEDHFRKGKLNLGENRREQAREEFDKAVDSILESGVDVRANPRLHSFFIELVERIYREEPLGSSHAPTAFGETTFKPSLAGPKQEPCTLAIDQAPAIRGVRLGMTISDVRALYPSISEPDTRNAMGVSNTVYVARMGESGLKGIDSLYLGFFRGRLYQLSVTYEQSFAQEAQDLTKPLNMPKETAEISECKGKGLGFDARLDLSRFSGEWRLWLTDTLAQEKITSLEAQLEENPTECQTPPVVRNVGLGITILQLRTLYPRAQVVRERKEVGELVLRNTGGDNPRLKGISTLWSYFLDGKLYLVVIDYTSQIEWKGIDEFVEHFGRATGLKTKWSGWNDRAINCPSFVVKAEMISSHPRVTITDKDAAVKLNKREERLKSPANFRP